MVKNRLILLSIIVYAFIICFPINTAAYESDVENYGDVNSDEAINSTDALIVLKHSAKLELIDELLLYSADVDGNKIIDASDALEILKYAAGIIDKFAVADENTVAETPVITEEPTPIPEYNGTEVKVKELNDVAVYENDEITFLNPDKHYYGVEMNNPFTGIDLAEGVTISFWFTPGANYHASDYGYTSLITFVNETTRELLKFDAEGTYQYSDSINRFKTKDAIFAVTAGNSYFMTCVITKHDLSYYANGVFIKEQSLSGHNEEVAYSKLINLLEHEDTKFYVGGDYSLNFIAASSKHKLAESTKVKDVNSYTYAMTSEEVKSLYEVNSNKNGFQMPEDFSGNVWIIGDSIAAYHEKTASIRPLYGWGELISEYFESDVVFHNLGISSMSTSSYYDLKRSTYNYIYTNLDKNDYVIISFGHNDHNPAVLDEYNRMTSPHDSTDTKYSFKWWLKNYYIDPALKKGAIPILMSPVVRCTYKTMGFYEEEMHLLYGTAMEELIAEYAEQGIKIYYIDAQDYTYNLYGSISREEVKLYHGQYGSEAGNFFDNTHYSEAGARMIVEYIISELKKTDLSITALCKDS